MSSAPGIFYAYARHTTTDWAWRYLITFESRTVADEWWRAVTDSVEGGYQRFKGVSRLSAQWYTHDPNDGGNIMDTVNDDRCAAKFKTKVMFTLLYDRDGRIFSAAEGSDYTDYKSGDLFFIRSVMQPNLFWYLDTSSREILASTERRTKFKISAIDQKDGTVMIGKDIISMRVIIPHSHYSDCNHICAGDRSLVVGERSLATELRFREFVDGFALKFYGPGAPGAQGEVVTITRDLDGLGERWELVN
ncbi:hypothetical protein BXZ70DRAFT_476266 [Cristinia sonorae]|uniref:Uncharacterized protein n=1 Tax=Cristinia sonorae TaxID=1940300 RepID=A0A8K0UH43_9AGAR|nr:hypothetical protein BXZ70DRAFT_476266 [Cristinia sonorae]